MSRRRHARYVQFVAAPVWSLVPAAFAGITAAVAWDLWNDALAGTDIGPHGNDRWIVPCRSEIIVRERRADA